MTRHLAAAAAVLAAVLWHTAVFCLAPRMRLVRPNFKGDRVMASYGIVSCAYAAAGTIALAALGYAEWRWAWVYSIVMGSMCLLGAIDDVFGSREVGGFRGHFRKLVLERKLTTGALKAVGGGVVGAAAGWVISGGDPVKWILAALLIPVAANTLNVLDLRPGRAVAVFFVGLGVTCGLAFGEVREPFIVGWIAIVAAAFAAQDCRARAMMGDSGANSLGAALGATIALSTGAAAQIAAIALFAGVQIYSEKYSVSALIERNAVLRAIDRRLGVR